MATVFYKPMAFTWTSVHNVSSKSKLRMVPYDWNHTHHTQTLGINCGTSTLFHNISNPKIQLRARSAQICSCYKNAIIVTRVELVRFLVHTRVHLKLSSKIQAVSTNSQVSFKG